jgi:hypothetical protein
MKNYTITKQQLRSINDPKVKEMFPDAFIEEFEVGSVYKNDSMIIKVTRIVDDKLYGYGFINEKFFDDNEGYWYSRNLKPATEEEFGKLLIKEAKKRGFKGEIYHQSFSGCSLGINTTIFNNGKWAKKS